MKNKEKVKRIVFDVIKDIDHSFVKNKKGNEIENIPLLGRFDSLSMVNLIIALEESIKNEFGKSISLIGEETGSSSPFQTIGTIINHINLCLSAE